MKKINKIKIKINGKLVKIQDNITLQILIKKFKVPVNKVAIDKGYDYILDSVSLLYGKPTHNLTDDVLYELRKISEEKSNNN